MKRAALALVVTVVVLGGGDALRALPTSYTIQDLGTVPSGQVPFVTGLNASGQVSGYFDVSSSVEQSARYTSPSGWVVLTGGTLANSSNQTTGINDSGDVVGYRTVGSETRAFRWHDGTGLEDIPQMSGGNFSNGLAIAANGDAVGWGNSSTGLHGWRASPLGLPGVVAMIPGSFLDMPCGVNASGQIVGSSFTPSFAQHAVRVNADGTVDDFGSFDGPDGGSNACGIDTDGTVVGQASLNGAQRAFRSSAAGLVNLDSFPGSTSSFAESISGGIVVGEYFLADNSSHAFIADAAGSTDLNTLLPAGSGWVLTSAKAINASGQIAGEGLLNGVRRTFLMTPVSKPADKTPPVINSLSVSPSTIYPPTGAMVTVTVSVSATDNVDPSPVCAIAGVDTHGAPASNAAVTGPFTGSVKATDHGWYTFTVNCSDASGNVASGSVDVIVPPDTTPPVISKVNLSPSTIWPPKGQTVTVTASAIATDDSGVAPVCKLGNITGPGTAPTDFNVTGANTGTVLAVGGRTYTFHEICTDGSGNYSWGSADVTVLRDTTAPVINSVTASPSTIWPPNDKLVPVTVSVSVTDDVDDAPACSLTSVSASGATVDDWSITGRFSALLRAVGGRTYTLGVTCSDFSGNSSSRSVNVVVPPDTTPPTITSLSASPSQIWPPNGKMVDVAVSVSATDDVDPNPSCSLTSISGGLAGGAVVTGPLSASLRADKDSVYSLRVTCSDHAGNRSFGDTTVTVTKDPGNGITRNRPK